MEKNFTLFTTKWCQNGLLIQVRYLQQLCVGDDFIYFPRQLFQFINP